VVQDRAVAQRARPELHAAVEACDDLLVREQRGDPALELVRPRDFQLRVGLDRGIDPVIATAALSLALTINIPSRIAVGWLGDLYDKTWLLNALAIAGGLALLAFALIGPGRVSLVWTYAILWGIGLAMLPLQAAWVADTFGRTHYGAINATSNSLALSGRIVGALGAAIAYDLLGSYTAVMLLGAAGFGLGAVLLVLLPNVLPKPSRA